MAGFEVSTEGMNVYLRLPMMLQLAGRNDEAWAEYNRLLIHAPGPEISRSGLGMWQSQVYDKMRLFRQREGKNVDAVRLGVLAFVCEAIAVHGDGQREDLSLFRDPEVIWATLEPLLHRADRLDALDALVSVTADFVRRVPAADLSKFLHEITSVLAPQGSTS